MADRQLLRPNPQRELLILLSAGSASASLAQQLNASSSINSFYPLEGRGLFHILFKLILKMQYPMTCHTRNTLLLVY